MTTAVNERLTNTWWLVLIQGIAILILSLLLLTSPGVTVASLVVFIGAYWLVDGIFSFIRIFLKDTDIPWGWLLVRGILGVLAGLYVLRHPLISAIVVPTVLVLIIGIQGTIMGVISLVEAFRGGGWGAGILGVINIIFGLILIFNPLLGAAILPWVMGVLGLIGGILLIVMAFRLR